MAADVSNSFAALDGAQFMVLATYRRSGVAVPTTVWFAEENGKLYVTTGIHTGKAKRIRNNPQVTVAPGDRVGNVSSPAVAAWARILSPGEAHLADEALDRKYGEQRKRVVASMGMGRDPSTTAFLEITPHE